jgi:hypothetical protein
MGKNLSWLPTQNRFFCYSFYEFDVPVSFVMKDVKLSTFESGPLKLRISRHEAQYKLLLIYGTIMLAIFEPVDPIVLKTPFPVIASGNEYEE